MSSNADQNIRPDYDDVLQAIADYALGYRIKSKEAWNTARNCLIDTLGCGLLALRFPECTKHLGELQTQPLVLPSHHHCLIGIYYGHLDV